MEFGEWRVELCTEVNLRHSRERPRLPLRREVARRIKDKNAVTEGEIH